MKDYEEFLAAPGAGPSAAISEQLAARVRADLNPNPFRVFSKLFLIHMVTALVTLSICPQFGFRVWGDGMGLMRVFMAFGEVGCLVACGSFFTGASLLVASLVLRGEEIRKIRQNRWLELGALTLLSLGFFIMVAPELLFELAAAWFIGALLGSAVTLELGWALRFRAIR